MYLRGPLALQAVDQDDGPPESIDSLKARARRAIPLIRARIADWNNGINPPAHWKGTIAQGKDPDARNAIYNGAYRVMRWELGRAWFAAATKVTGVGAARSLNGALPRVMAWLTVLTTEDMDFVVAGNAFLFPYNMHNYFALTGSSKEIPGMIGLRERALDHALVGLEQTLIQDFMDGYAWKNAQAKQAALGRIGAGFLERLADPWIKGKIKDLFGRSFNFGDINHRIRLGIAIVDDMRKRRP